ncbi:hypothetical protein NQ314_003750 [Rhamnusium bicolor]|uniref:Reverse transcriptase domain-containing protein n=1 Tax=Rhamnusium bicolor TaxID=1586634 RepID=A0AAV8ZP11_9CUCU|nr:hypothetical protein NQ314_003750 [Rhamnusium bicolor]
MSPLYLVNSSLETDQIPSLLKISTVILILEVSGSNKANDLRSINMLVVIEKLTEKIVYNQLSEFITDNNILTSNESSFRKAHSCDTVVQNVVTTGFR